MLRVDNRIIEAGESHALHDDAAAALKKSADRFLMVIQFLLP